MARTLSDVLVVLPAFNEEASIAQTIAEIESKIPGIEKLVVDDGSVDNTVLVAKSTGAKVASLPFNLGVGGAMRFGFRYAVQHGFRVVIQLDADGQHDPSYVPELLEALANADLVIGARFAGEGDYEVRGPRRWAMSMLSTVLSRTAKTRLSDTTSGFRASGPRAIALFAKEYPAEYLGDTVESLVTAMRNGLIVKQVPVAMRARAAGQPSQNAWRSTVFLARAFAAMVIAYVRPRMKAGESE